MASITKVQVCKHMWGKQGLYYKVFYKNTYEFMPDRVRFYTTMPKSVADFIKTATSVSTAVGLDINITTYE